MLLENREGSSILLHRRDVRRSIGDRTDASSLRREEKCTFKAMLVFSKSISPMQLQSTRDSATLPMSRAQLKQCPLLPCACFSIG